MHSLKGRYKSLFFSIDNMIIYIEMPVGSTGKLLEPITELIKSKYKNQLYFYILVINNWKVKF